jgi:outer membrane receptor protein involved in Fe transport
MIADIARLNSMHTRILLFLTFTVFSFGQQTGTVAGQIYDASNGTPVRQALVEVVGADHSKAVTDTKGRFRLELPPGAYQLKISAPNYNPQLIEDIAVVAGEVVDASSVLSSATAVTTIDVVERVSAVASTAESALAERRLAPVVSDSISAEDIRSSPASDAASALEKVTGVSVVDGGFVYVRGLGERYSSTMLNNAMIPTTEPERRVVPLDLFPASLIDNIKILKTYSADLPGEFSGGLVQMSTIDFPTAKTLLVSVNYGFNSLTTFNRFNAYPGGRRDWTGFDDGTRSLPSIIPADTRLFAGKFSDEEFQRFGRAFASNYEIQPIASMRPAHTYSISGGNTWGRLGLVGALTFTNSPQRLPELRRFLVNSGGGQAQIFSDYPVFDVDTQSVRLGGVLNAALRLNAANKLVFRNSLTRDTDNEARFIDGLNGSTNNFIQSTRLRWVERSLVSTGVEGEHVAAALKNSLFFWQFTYSLSSRNEPDLRETIYGRLPEETNYFYLNVPEGGLRFFNNLNDKIYEPQGAWSIPFYRGAFSGIFKAGFRATIRRRDFGGRRFRFFPTRAQTIDFTKSANEVLGPGNIRPDGFVLREITRGTDAYDARMNIYGGFGMLDMNLGGRWRLIAGLRIEDADINVKTIDPLVPGGIPSVANLVNRDLLPSVNLIYALKPRQNLRFGYGRTVNRPDFRELSPFEFTNVIGGYSTTGNPDLRRATIDNFDARWEAFLGGNQVIAASYFYKRFTDPIEQIYRPTASELRQSFINVAGAKNQGVELEMRKGLGSWTSKLSNFAVQTNFTLVDSDVEIPVDRFPQLTSRARPLMGQSRFIYNVMTEFTRPKWRSKARFYVNSVSRRITDVGTFQLPDVFQERNTFLDLVYNFNLDERGKWSFRFSAENINNNEYRFTQSDIIVRQFRIGRTFTIGTSYSFF